MQERLSTDRHVGWLYLGQIMRISDVVDDGESIIKSSGC